ncbi:MAG: cation diffusion facilitator family transporter [Candidatus Aenigmarchaeota archaeon]|nr:cation diffusion facilitator family transporter [Candidatus Aenigmarchaeota archaeon]
MKQEKINKLKKGERAALLSSIVTFLLASLKMVVGIISGTTILISDGLHSFTDLVTDFASWFGLKISQRRANEKFPYGYYKAENLAALFISFLILYAAIELMKEGYSRLFEATSLNMPLEALGVAVIAIVFSLVTSRYLKKIGTEISSQSLLANAEERTVDILASMVVFVGLLLTYYHVPYVEGLVTILISLLILKIGIFNLRDSLLALMDVSPSKEIEDKVKRVLESIGGVESYENLKLRRSGPFIFGEVTLKLRKYLDVKRAHEIADKIEEEIKRNVSEIESFTIHIEPYEANEQKIAIPIKSKKWLKSPIAKILGRAPYYIFITVDKKKREIKSMYIKKNPYTEKNIRAGLSAAKFLLNEKIDALATKEIGEITFHKLRDDLVDIYKAEGKNVEEVVKKFIRNKLKLIREPTKEKA